MGNFYTNFTLRGPSQEAVAAVLAGRSALVARERDGFVVAFDEESDGQDVDIIAGVAEHLSDELGCVVLVVMNHDDDILWYQLYVNGGLEDEYDSCPNYFSTTDAEAAPPSGGDALTLCGAFGVTNFKRVARILRTAWEEDGGYIFAVQRHADLADALGIPSLSVGAAYEQIADGDLPEGLRADDLMRTTGLPAPGPNIRTRVNAGDKIIPGYYKVRFSATNLALPFRKSFPAGWMPGRWAELECGEGELSVEFQRATGAARGRFKELGFAEAGFKRSTRTLNPNQRDNGGINYLDRDRCHFGQILYSRFASAASDAETENLTLAFTAVFESEVVSITNDIKGLFGEVPKHRVARIKSNDVVTIYNNFLDLIRTVRERPRHFTEFQAFRDWFDKNSVEVLEHRVRRGLFVRMNEYEIATALRKLPPPRT